MVHVIAFISPRSGAFRFELFGDLAKGLILGQMGWLLLISTRTNFADLDHIKIWIGSKYLMLFEYFDLFPIWVFGFEIENDSSYIRHRRPMYLQDLFKNDESRTTNRSVCLQRM
jgi:hypothetical protein